MPHAGGQTQNDSSDSSGNQEKKQGSGTSRSRAGKIADKARDNPKTAVAAGAAIVGAIAAAAIPAVRAARKKSSETKGSGGSKKSSGSGKSGSSDKSS
jgi:hypothetical protein